RRIRHQLADDLELLADELAGQKAHARGIAAWMIEARHETEFDRIDTDRENDRNGSSGTLGRQRRWCALASEDNGHRSTHEFISKGRKPLISVLGPPIGQLDI